MTAAEAELLDKGRILARELRQAGRDDAAETVDALLQVAEAASASSPFLTTGEVAQRVGVSRQTVVNWIKKGLIPEVRLGGRTMVSPIALEKFAPLERILNDLDAEREPLSPEEAAEVVARDRKGWAWRQDKE